MPSYTKVCHLRTDYARPSSKTVILVYSSPLANFCGISWRSWLDISLYWWLRLECSLVTCSWPCRVFVPHSPNWTKISWPSFCGWSWMSPQCNLWLSSLARKPRCRDIKTTIHFFEVQLDWSCQIVPLPKKHHLHFRQLLEQLVACFLWHAHEPVTCTSQLVCLSIFLHWFWWTDSWWISMDGTCRPNHSFKFLCCSVDKDSANFSNPAIYILI